MIGGYFMTKIIKHKNKNETIEYLIRELNLWEDFDKLCMVLIENMDAQVLQEIDGIYIRRWLFELNEIKFYLIHDNHFGNFAYTLSQTENDNILLKKILDKLLDYIS